MSAPKSFFPNMQVYQLKIKSIDQFVAICSHPALV